jgi:hypothetical protein
MAIEMLRRNRTQPPNRINLAVIYITAKIKIRSITEKIETATPISCGINNG